MLKYKLLGRNTELVYSYLWLFRFNNNISKPASDQNIRSFRIHNVLPDIPNTQFSFLQALKPCGRVVFHTLAVPPPITTFYLN